MNKLLITQNNIDVPLPNTSWVALEENLKIKKIQEVLIDAELNDLIRVSRIVNNINIYFEIIKQIDAANRGTLLLDLEQKLKDSIDKSLLVWCEPLGDKNSLRKLRGIQIKNGVGS